MTKRRKAHPKYTNMFMHLMDETPAIIEKITETDKIDNELKQKKKEERKKVTENKKAPKNTKKMEELYDTTTKKERMAIDTERAKNKNRR